MRVQYIDIVIYIDIDIVISHCGSSWVRGIANFSDKKQKRDQFVFFEATNVCEKVETASTENLFENCLEWEPN